MQNLRNKAYKALRGSEGFFKTDMVYLAQGSFWLSLSQVVAMLSGFLISIAFANLLPKESFGTYKFVLSMAGMLGILSLSGLGTAVTQAVAQNFGGSLWQGFRSNLKWSLGMALGGLILSVYYYVNDNNTLSISFLLAGILSPITASASLYGAYLLGKKDFRRISFFSMVRTALPAAALIMTVLLTQHLPMLITVYFFSGVIVSLFLYYRTTRAYWRDNDKENPELTSYSRNLSLMDIIGNIANYLDKILVFHYLGAAPLAIFAFAISPVEQLQSGKKILSTLILPKSSERTFEELQQSAPRKIILLIIYALVLAGLWILLAPHFYKLFFPQYLDSVGYSQLYALTLLAVAATVSQEALVAHKKTKELYLHRTIVPIVQIALFFILLPYFGLWGLIAAHIIVRFFSAILAYYFLMRPFQTPSN